MSGRALFLAIWTPLMAATVWSLFFQKTRPGHQGKPLANVEMQIGDIQYRTEDEVLWSSTEENQYVFENDNIATGDNSYASLNFGNKRVVELGPNTQIRIRPLGGTSGSFELDLVHGSLAARDRSGNANGNLAASGAGNLKINAGDKSFNLNGKADLGLELARAAKESSIMYANGSVQMTADGRTSTLANQPGSGPLSLLSRIDQGLEIVRPAAPPPPKPKPLAAKLLPPPVVAAPPPPAAPPAVAVVAPPSFAAEEAQAKAVMPRLLHPPENSILWIADSLANAASKVIPIALDPPQGIESTRWQPLLGAFTDREQERSSLMWEGVAEVRRQVFPITLAQLEAKGALREDAGQPPEQEFIIAPGVKIPKDDKWLPFFGEKRAIVARSCDVKLQGPVRIDLARMDFKETRPSWFVTPREFETQSAIYVGEGEVDMAKLAPVLQMSRGFRWSAKEEAITGQGVFILRDNKVVGKINGAIGGQRALEAIRVGIGADAIYRGSAQAYIGGLPEFKERAVKNLLPEKVYILNDGRFIAVNRDFMKTNPTLRRFLDDHSPAFFAEPIETLAANNFLEN